MADRKISYIVRDQKPLIMPEWEAAQNACRAMCERRAGSVLVVDQSGLLTGIFTGRDAVRTLSLDKAGADTKLSAAMTRNPQTISPHARAIDALRMMSDGGFRHLPVVEDGRILGIVSRGDFKGVEIEQFDDEEHLWECIR